METLVYDLRFGIRSLSRSPGFTVVVLLILALGIGANSAIFSVVDTVLLRLLPYEDPDRLVMVWDSNPEMGLERTPISYPNYLEWAEQNSVFVGQAAYGHSAFNLTDGDEPERVWGLRTSAGLFPALGVAPVLGRVIRPEENAPGAEPVVVLSNGLWQRTFGGDSELIGRTVKLDGASFTVVGVMPANFEFPQFPQNIPVDLWLPLAPFADSRPRSSRSVLSVAKLKEGVTLQQAQADITTIASRLELQYPDANAGWTSVVVPLHGLVVGPARLALLILLGAVGLVLLIACANVANLMMARAAARRREIALCLALGAGRIRVVRKLLTESLLLALLGGIMGLLVAHWGLQLLIGLSPGNIPRLEEVALDARVLGFTLAISLLTGVLFGLIPALQASGLDLNEALKEGNPRPTAGFGGLPVRSTLVVAEIALASVLLIGAGLLIKSFVQLLDVEPGFDSEELLSMEILLPELSYPDEPAVRGFVDGLVERTASLPGVRSAGIVNFLPLSGYSAARPFTIDDRPLPPGERPRAEERAVSPDYFRTMGISLVAGRLFREQDNEDAPPVVIISESMARRYWPDEDPIGKRLTTSSLAAFLRDGWSDRYGSREIVGVVSDVRYSGLASPVDDVMYLPYRQDPWAWMFLVVKTAVDPGGLVGPVRGEVRGLDPELAVFNVWTMGGLLYTTVAQERFNMLLLGSFAALAMALAAAGIYGVISYLVAQRTQEISVRMALGARPADVLKLVVGRGAVLALVGAAIGLAGAAAVTRVMSSLLFEVTPTDPLMFALVTALLTGVALVASYLPARQAAKADPMIALRSE